VTIGDTQTVLVHFHISTDRGHSSIYNTTDDFPIISHHQQPNKNKACSK